MTKFLVLLSATIIFSACKQRRLSETNLASESTDLQYIDTQVYGSDGQKHQVKVLKPRKGVWAFGRDPRGELTAWPDPEGQYEVLPNGLYTWPKNWPISPTGAMPYEKLFGFERFISEKRRSGSVEISDAVVGSDDYHFDCDDFALAHHRWCAFNAGKKCYSIRIDFYGDSLKKQTEVNQSSEAPLDAAWEASFEAPGLDFSKIDKPFSAKEVVKATAGAMTWAMQFKGDYKLIPGHQNAPLKTAKLEITANGRKKTLKSANVKRGGGYIFQQESECKLQGTPYYCHDLVKLSEDRKVNLYRKYIKKESSGHIMVVHETENKKNSNPKYCLIEYYYYPHHSKRAYNRPSLYGCWEGSSSLPKGKVPQSVLDQARLYYSNKIFIRQSERVFFEPIHSGVHDNLSRFRIDGNFARYTAKDNQTSFNLTEPEYGRSRLSATIFAYFTGLNPLHMNPLTNNDLRRYGLDSAKSVGNSLTRAGMFHGTRMGIDPFASDSDFSNNQGMSLDDRIKSLLDLKSQGLLQK